MDDTDDLVLKPLSEMLSLCAKCKRPCAMVVTMKEHTTSYMMDGRGRTFHFDPLPAALVEITGAVQLPHGAEYSGLLLYKNDEPC
jgi:hypothetical protein